MTKLRPHNPPRDLSRIILVSDTPDTREPSEATRKRWDKAEQSLVVAKCEHQFLVACARAFWKGELRDDNPSAPNAIRADVNAYGGNIAWIEALPTRRKTFIKIKKQISLTPKTHRDY
jgi:hypothetical protein